MNEALVAAAVLFVTMVLSALLVPPSKRLAARIGAIDAPGARKVHRVPTPRMGGVAVFTSFTVLVAAGAVLAPRLADLGLGAEWRGAVEMLAEAPRVHGRLFAVLLGATIAFLVGLSDDVLGARFPVWMKAAGQLVAALVVVAAGVRTSIFPFEPLNVLITVLWLVGMTNAFNLLDNMDGLSAGVALVASTVFFFTAWSLGEFFISLLLAAFMGSLIGFLFFNFSPASVFLGDNGSLFVGFVMGSLTLLERYVSHASSSLFPVLMPLVVLAVPILDTATVVAIRLREGRPIYVGDSCHLSHRLVHLGFTHRTAVLLLYLLTFGLGAGAALLPHATAAQSVVILVQSVAVVAIVLILMYRRPAARAGEMAA